MSDLSQDGLAELVEEYALGLLDGDEKAAFEARLATDAQLQQRVREAQVVLADVALSTPVALPSSLKGRVMAQATPHSAPVAPVVETPVVPIRRPGNARGTLWLGMALAASLLLMVKLSRDLSEERTATALATQRAGEIAATLVERDSLIARLTDPEVELVTLAATGEAKPTVKVYLDRARRSALLTIASLDAAPEGRVYQLWFIVDGAPVPSVTFQTDAQGRAVIERVTMPTGTIAATAVTMEPTGGSTTPTAPILFVGGVKTE